MSAVAFPALSSFRRYCGNPFESMVMHRLPNIRVAKCDRSNHAVIEIFVQYSIRKPCDENRRVAEEYVRLQANWW